MAFPKMGRLLLSIFLCRLMCYLLYWPCVRGWLPRAEVDEKEVLGLNSMLLKCQCVLNASMVKCPCPSPTGGLTTFHLF